MARSRRALVALGAGCAVLLGGVLGLALWWWWTGRRGFRPRPRLRRTSIALVAGGVIVIGAGALWRLEVAVRSVPACSPPGGVQAAPPSRGFDAALTAEKVTTWPETGIAMLYAQTGGAHICYSRAAAYYVAVHADNIAGARAVNMGDIVLTPGFDVSREQLRTLIGHEARHRPQWAVGTVIAGPLAFPAAYGVDDFFFPGPRNHFERLAGLESGGYSHRGAGPVLGPLQVAAFAVLAVVALLLLWHARRRRRHAARAQAPCAVSEPRAVPDGGQPPDPGSPM